MPTASLPIGYNIMTDAYKYFTRKIYTQLYNQSIIKYIERNTILSTQNVFKQFNTLQLVKKSINTLQP